MGYHTERKEYEVPGSIVVIAAHAFEARAAAAVGRGVIKEPWGGWMLYRGEMWDLPLAVIRSGPGKVTAAAAAQAAVQYLEPAVIVSFGVAGTTENAVRSGTLVIGRTVVDVALEALGDLPVKIPARFHAPSDLHRCFLDVPGGKEGSVLCWEGHVASPVHRPTTVNLGDGPVAVDWESSAVAHVAQMWNIPWAALKVISDHGEDDRLRRVAVVARRPLQWAAEVLRRACSVYVGATQDAAPAKEEDISSQEAQGED